MKGESYAQEEAERSVKALGETLKQTFCKLKYVTILFTRGFSIETYRKGLTL